jgi:hypothetical protein
LGHAWETRRTKYHSIEVNALARNGIRRSIDARAWALTRFGQDESAEQFAWCHAEGVDESPDLQDPDLAVAALDEANDGSVKPGLVGQLFLSEPLRDAEEADSVAELAQVLGI